MVGLVYLDKLVRSAINKLKGGNMTEELNQDGGNCVQYTDGSNYAQYNLPIKLNQTQDSNSASDISVNQLINIYKTSLGYPNIVLGNTSNPKLIDYLVEVEFIDGEKRVYVVEAKEGAAIEDINSINTVVKITDKYKQVFLINMATVKTIVYSQMEKSEEKKNESGS